MRLLADLDEFRVRHAHAGGAVLAIEAREIEELGGIFIRERLEKHSVNHAEDRGIGADAESQRQHCDHSESGVFPQHAEREFHILQNCGNSTPPRTPVSKSTPLDMDRRAG